MNRYSKLCLLCFFVSLLSACMSFGKNIPGSKSKLYQTFYLGEEGTQYFIKPIILKSIDSNDLLYIDFTFKNKDDLIDEVIVNFSLISNSAKEKANDFLLTTKENNLLSSSLKLLFKEVDKNEIYYRYTCKMSFIDVKNFLNGEDVRASILTKKNSYTFRATPKTEKKLKRMDKELLILF